MLTSLDAELFPDDCEVVEIPSRGLWVYLIQKNGSSSFRRDIKKQGWPVFKNQDIGRLSYIDVFIRDPEERYFSGVNTFVQHLLRDDPSLDQRTCTFLAVRYPFLNRHYLPQWHWLLNLSRFIDPRCKIRLHGMQDLDKATSNHDRADVAPYNDVWKSYVEQHMPDLDLWFLLDKILLGYCGQALTWPEILAIYKNHPNKPLEMVTKQIELINDVLSKA